MSSLCCVMGQRAFLTPNAQQAGAVIAHSVGIGGMNQPADTKTIQGLLNQVAPIALAPKPLLTVDGVVGPLTNGAIRQFQSRTGGPTDGRIDPNGPTIARLNVLTYKPGSTAKGFAATAPTPPTPAMTPMQAAMEAIPRAQMWTNAALMQIAGLRAATSVSLFNLPPSPDVTMAMMGMINTHFHLDREPDRLSLNLVVLQNTYLRISTMLANPAKYMREGPETALSHWADAPVGGMDLAGEQNLFHVRTQFPNVGPNCRSAMLVHEGAHFCGQNAIIHFAFEFPPPDGGPQDGSTHNYAQMTTAEALRNASSYAAFAIHAFLGVDERYGLHRPNV